MHDSALKCGEAFSEIFGGEDKIVVDIGGMNMNGSLRQIFESKKMKFISVDCVEHESVDVVVKHNDKLPFETSSVDLIISTSCFSYNPCFWMTFKEMARILKPNGFIYINTPSNNRVSRPTNASWYGDHWRFCADSGQALAYWSTVQLFNEETHPVKVLETFHLAESSSKFQDFICIWQKVEQNEAVNCNRVSDNIILRRGTYEMHLIQNKNIETDRRIWFK